MKVALTKFACLDCHRVLKRPADMSMKSCPNCGAQSYLVGSDFKAPASDDVKAWEVSAYLIRAGFSYFKMGLRYPMTMSEAVDFVKTNAHRAVEPSMYPNGLMKRSGSNLVPR